MPSRAVTVLDIRVVILHVIAWVMLADPHCYRGTIVRSWGSPVVRVKAGAVVCSIPGHAQLVSPQQCCFGQELKDLNLMF